jgi:hypothetical protein
MGLFPLYCVDRGQGEAKMALFARFGMVSVIADALPARIGALDGEPPWDGARPPPDGFVSALLHKEAAEAVRDWLCSLVLVRSACCHDR